jgi:hypothetical protein
LKFLCAFALTASTLGAHAALVDQGTTTLDTASRLEWLDLSQSSGYSFKQVVGQMASGGKFEGYRYASAAEAQSMFSQLGFPVTPYQNMVGDYKPAFDSFNSLLGLNYGGLGGNYAFNAEVGDTIPGHPGYHPLFWAFPASIQSGTDRIDGADVPRYVPGISINTSFASDADSIVVNGYNGGWFIYHDVTTGYHEDTVDNSLAHFLVRPATVDAVPEPETYALMLLGIGCIGAAAKRRQLRATAKKRTA